MSTEEGCSNFHCKLAVFTAVRSAGGMDRQRLVAVAVSCPEIDSGAKWMYTSENLEMNSQTS